MPYVRDAVSMLEVFNPKRRAKLLPGFDARYLHRTARNLASALAALHARAFEGQGRAWSAAEFSGLLASPHVVCVPSPAGFALGRVIAGEAELLTLAVDPAQQRSGHGSALLAGFEQEAAQRGAASAYLDVSAQNAPALALYAQAGYREVARRAGYYHPPDGSTADALILTKDLP